MTESESDYEYFMVYELEDDGTRSRVEVPEEDLESILNPEEVFVIVKEPIRRIFIWKGAKSPVRKRFISSRVASGLQEELVKKAAFHRCKIVSVDQGDEVREFLQAFHLESMEVEDKLEDMRYVRNAERDSAASMGQVVDETAGRNNQESEEYYSPALEELKKKGVDINASVENNSNPKPKPKSSSRSSQSSPISRSKPTRKKVKKEKVIEKVLNTELPENFQRQNLILGKNLYGAVSKVTNVFGNDIEKTNWELVNSLPEGTFILKNYLFRVYFDAPNNLVEAVEILKDEKSNSKMEKVSITLPENKKTLDEKILEVEVPENYKRINLIEGHRLYGATSKTVKVFGEEHEELQWELLDNVPEGVVKLENHVFRVYFNNEKETVEAVEVLQEEDVKKAKLKSNENENETKSSKKRNLKKIPKE